MSKYRKNLPLLSEKQFLTDGGLETTLLFHKGFELPEFAAFDILMQPKGYATLCEYYQQYIDVALEHGVGFILESPTWRASSDWGAKLGYSVADLKEMNCKSISFLEDLRRENENGRTKLVISGCLGPRGDGYQLQEKMTAVEARDYHQEQIATFSLTEADLVSAYTINYVEEAIGITLAARKVGMPVVISFTLETDGRLPSGQLLGEAITEVDRETDNGPAYYMINCAHPSHFIDALQDEEPWLERIHAVRANASKKSHAELDEAEELDEGDPVELGRRYGELRVHLPHLNVFGGCCGTDHRHVEEICRVVTA